MHSLLQEVSDLLRVQDAEDKWFLLLFLTKDKKCYIMFGGVEACY